MAENHFKQVGTGATKDWNSYGMLQNKPNWNIPGLNRFIAERPSGKTPLFIRKAWGEVHYCKTCDYLNDIITWLWVYKVHLQMITFYFYVHFHNFLGTGDCNIGFGLPQNE